VQRVPVPVRTMFSYCGLMRRTREERKA
jgi:hypothetical protein